MCLIYYSKNNNKIDTYNFDMHIYKYINIFKNVYDFRGV